MQLGFKNIVCSYYDTFDPLMSQRGGYLKIIYIIFTD